MKIKKKRNKGCLTLQLDGRLDTTTAPQLEQTLKEDVDSVETLVFDMTNIEYVSSAGLRVLLAAFKTMRAKNGTMKIGGVNEEVMEVFTITGLADLLKMEQA